MKSLMRPNPTLNFAINSVWKCFVKISGGLNWGMVSLVTPGLKYTETCQTPFKTNKTIAVAGLTSSFWIDCLFNRNSFYNQAQDRIWSRVDSWQLTKSIWIPMINSARDESDCDKFHFSAYKLITVIFLLVFG